MATNARSFVKREGINPISVSVFTLFHVGAIASLFFFSWPAFFAALVLYWVSLSLGIGMGYHRLLTHRSYKPPKGIEYLLATCGTLALQGGPMFWVAAHRVHHQFSDKDGDPHTPRDGKWWSHIGWMLVGDATHCNIDECARYAPDICKDRFLVWLSKYNYLPLVVLSILLLALGGLPFLLWGMFFRVTMGLHATWMVNSLSHCWGRRRFATRDGSRNNWFVALLSFGEGWHNNHHAYPTSARHGLAWYELDMNWLAIRFLQMVGLAKSVRSASLHRLGYNVAHSGPLAVIVGVSSIFLLTYLLGWVIRSFNGTGVPVTSPRQSTNGPGSSSPPSREHAANGGQGFVDLCKSIRLNCWQRIEGDDGHCESNALILNAAYSDYERQASPWLSIILSSHHEDPGVVKQARNAAAKCLSSLAGGFLCVNLWVAKTQSFANEWRSNNVTG